MVLLLIGISSLNQKAYSQVANSGFETGTLASWSGTSGVSVSAGYTAGNWTVNPSGGNMARMEPTYDLTQGTAEANLGLAPGALGAFNSGVFSSATNFGTLTQSVTLNAGQSFTMYWNYLSQDYAPFNDGIFASLTGPGYQNIQLLAVTASSYGDPQPIVTGDYGSTGWHAVTFTAGAAGTYTLGFSDFNYLDQALNPIQANDNAPGGTSAPGQPVVTTAAVTSTSTTTATSGGNVTADGGSAVTDRGVCWGTAAAPTTAGNYTTDGTGTGAFTSSLTGLTPGATYFIRAYATNITGTVYGPEVILAGDTQPPVITTNGNKTVSTNASACSAIVAVSATATDNVSTVTPTGVRNDGLALTAAYPKGTTTVNWTATDAAGNVGIATQTVTVNDTELPTILAPAAKAASTNAGQCSATNVALGTAAAGDNCPGVVVTNNAPATFPKGVTTVTWTATDAAGNVATATQVVTVTDNELPTISAPAAKAVSTNAGQCSATNVALGTAAAGDNCPGVVVSNNAPATFPKGVTTVTWTATDAAGNVATATQVVTVTDNELPTITAPAAKAASTNAGQCSATGVALGTAATGDNCSGVVVTNNAPATFPKGVTTVTWKATDAAGNVATATQTVTVTDNERPVLGALPNLVLSAPAVQCGAVVSFNPTATDNCAGATVVSSPASGSTFVVGTSTVTVTATDASGNQSTGSFTVTVNDVTAPAVVTRNVSVTLVNGAATVTTAQVDNGSTDACGIMGYRLSRTVFTCANIGPNPVVLTVTDAHGNAASAPAVVTVMGTIPAPVVTVVPASSVYTGGVPTTLYLGYGPQSATLSTPGFVSYAWSPAAGLSSPSSGAPVFTATAVGTYTYTVSVVNQYGCTATTSVTLRVVDVRCGNNNDKVIVCHNGHEICISPNAVSAHLTGHPGDQLGTCGTAARSASTATPLAKLLLETAPNPFSASTTVHFRPVVTAAAQVHVYDALGRVVATLFDDIAEAGHDYTLTLSGEHLANGIYLCRYESQGKVQTQRLSLVK